MDNFSLLKSIALIAIFIALLLTFFLIAVKSKNKQANILLAGFVMCCAVDIGGIIIGPNLKDKPGLYESIKSFIFLIFPLLYYYVLSVCHINFKLKFRSLFHTLPFLLYNILIFSLLLFGDRNSSLSVINKLVWASNRFLLKVQVLCYLIAIIYILRNYKKVYLENYANGNIDIYKWLSGIVLIFLITLPVTVIKDFSRFNDYQEVFTWTIMVLTVTALILLCWFILKALFTPELFRGIDPKIKPAGKLTNIKNVNRSLKPKLDSKNSALLGQLKKYMIEKEPFLEPTLTLQDLALQMNIPARELSILINRYTGQHFFDFINRYRIEKAMEIIKKTTKDEFTIQQILFDVGFNSKSSFNTAFKKQTQLTPSEYKNLHSKKI